MRAMFKNASSFNQDVNDWNVENVTDMCKMWIMEPAAFNQPLNNWNVSNVTNMNCMFEYTKSFNY